MMKILFATDGSHHASHAAEFLNTIDTKDPIDLTVLTVRYVPTDPESGNFRTWFPEWQAREKARIDEHYAQLDQLLHHVRGSVHMMQTDGSPARTILKAANEIDADLIVLGARGHSAIERIVIGSVSDAVATHANCSVLVVRPSKTDQSKSDFVDRETPRQALHITLAYDGSRGAQAAANELLEFDWRDDTTLDILSVVPRFDYFGQEYAVMVQMDDEQDRLRVEGEKVAVPLRKSFPKVTVDSVSGNHIGESIVAHADELGSDVIILGEDGHSALGELLLGSTTKYVLRHAKTSVWISRMHRSANKKTDASTDSMQGLETETT